MPTIYEDMAPALQTEKARLAELKTYIDDARTVGIDVSKQLAQYEHLKVLIAKWEQVFAARGISLE